MPDYRAHFDELFRALETEHGKLDELTLGSIIGFGAGGPVSLSSIVGRKLFVTCELSLYPQQLASADGFKYELLVRGWLNESLSGELLTALGEISMRAKLGHGHTIDVTGVLPENLPRVVRLMEYSRTSIGTQGFGIYEVVDATSSSGR